MAPPKRPWFRFYVEAIYDRKLRRLPPAQRWLWVVILAIARQSPIPGVLLLSVDGVDGAVTDDDLADASGLKVSDVRKGLDAMASVGMLITDLDLGAWRVVAWNERQYESDKSTERASKHRAKHDDATTMQRPNAVDATPPEAETDTDINKSVGNTTAVEPPERLREPGTWLERLDPSGPVAIRGEAVSVLNLAANITGDPLTPTDRRTLKPVIEEALTAGYSSDQLANAVAHSPFRTRNGVMGELRKRKQQPTSVGNRGLDVAFKWVEGDC